MTYIKDVEAFVEELHGFLITTAHVQTKQAAEQLKRPVGSYITIEAKTMLSEHTKIDEVGECLTEILDRLLRPYYGGMLCICGLGNWDSPADALGPEVTRNLPLKALSEIETAGNFRNVYSITPGTVLTNNINTETIVSGVVKAIGADCLLLVDSLLSMDPSRLFQTIQLSTNGGLSPYLSGRKADWDALGIPVISLGVPLAISLSTLVPGEDLDDDVLTSVKIHNIVAAAGRIIAYAILRVCWPSKSKAECFVLSGLNRNPVPYSVLQEEDQDTAGPA